MLDGTVFSMWHELQERSLSKLNPSHAHVPSPKVYQKLQRPVLRPQRLSRTWRAAASERLDARSQVDHGYALAL